MIVLYFASYSPWRMVTESLYFHFDWALLYTSAARTLPIVDRGNLSFALALVVLAIQVAIAGCSRPDK